MLENPATKEQERDDARDERRSARERRAASMLADEFHDALAAGPRAPLSTHSADALGLPVFEQAELLPVLRELLDADHVPVLSLLFDVFRRFYLRDDPLTVDAAEQIAQAYAAREVQSLRDTGAFNDGAEYDDGH